jgi:hypothetical protein
MAKKERATFTVEPGRVILKNGETFLLVAVPSAFFAHAPSATQEEADKITLRIAELLTEHGE